MSFMPSFSPKSICRPKILTLSLASALLVACGGGSGDSSSNSGSGQTKEDVKPVVDSIPDIEPEEDAAVLEETDGDKVTSDITTTPVTAEIDDSTPPTTQEPTTPAVPEDSVNLSASEMAVYNRLNSRRDTCDFGRLALNDALKKSADNHANYLLYMSENSNQTFQGHYEKEVGGFSGANNPFFTGFSVKERVNTTANIGSKAQAVNYNYRALTENLSFLRYNQAYLDQSSDPQIALNSIKGLLAAPYHMATLLSPVYQQVGIGYGRTELETPILMSDGSTQPGYGSVLELVMATPSSVALKAAEGVLSYPCNGITDTQYELKHESPHPFGGDDKRDLSENPIGQPVYIYANDPIVVTDYSMKDAAGNRIKLHELNQTTDPNKVLKANQVILMPDVALKPNQLYSVSYKVSVDGARPVSKSFTFKTKAK